MNLKFVLRVAIDQPESKDSCRFTTDMQFETHKSPIRNPAQIKRMHASDINIHPLQTELITML